MLDFSSFDNTVNAFPFVQATNASGPTLRDGTPITASLINDIWGAFQAILGAAGTTPSGSLEFYAVSDLRDSIRKIGGAPGEVVMYATPSDAIDANILPLKGQIITIASYSKLVAATYIGDANNSELLYRTFYKCSDSAGATRNTAGPYFAIPDCRGYFLRSLAGAATGRDAARDYMATTYGVDYRNMSGRDDNESPGWHVHDVVADLTSAGKLVSQQIWVFTTSPGTVGGSVPTQIQIYKRSSGTTEPLTRIGRLESPAIDYSSLSYYNEVRPKHVAFQLGIRY